jgi:hypothetical protein
MLGLIEIFYAPGKVFDYVREKRAFLWALLANIVLFGGMYFYTVNAIGASNITRRALESSRFAGQMPPDVKEKSIADSDLPAKKIQNAVGTAVFVGVVFVITALLYMAIAGASSSPIKFTQALGTASYAAWPIGVLTTILTVVVITLAADKTELDPQYLLAFNAGALLDRATASKTVYKIASDIDLLAFAQIALSAFGLSKVARIAFSKALIGTILVWVLYSLLGIARVALLGM